MNYIQRMEHWGDTHHPKWVDIIRMAFGIFLFWKGIEFANDMNTLMQMMAGLPFGNFMMIILAHYVLFAHILGGFLLVAGLLTRLACIIQIPVVLAAIFLNIFEQFSELSLSILTLILLVYFLIIGSGRWSLDWYINKDYTERNTASQR